MPLTKWMKGLVAALLVADSVAILVGGVLGGRWVWGLVFAVAVLAATWDWLRLRASDTTPHAVADRLVLSILFLALGLAMPAIRVIEGALHW